MENKKLKKEKKLGEISLLEDTPAVFSPSPVWKMEKEYGPNLMGLNSRGDIPARELKKLGVRQYRK